MMELLILRRLRHRKMIEGPVRTANCVQAGGFWNAADAPPPYRMVFTLSMDEELPSATRPSFAIGVMKFRICVSAMR